MPEHTVGYGLTETPRVTLTPIGEGEAGHRTGVDVGKNQSINVVLPEGVTTANWRGETVTLPMPEPTQEDVVRGAVIEWARSGAEKMPFLPIEQLPESWKDGRAVLMKDTVIWAVARHEYESKPWKSPWKIPFYDEGDEPYDFTPTHFCTIPLE